jgi:tRNASer (uridine44-2'-O)-methyltransferase
VTRSKRWRRRSNPWQPQNLSFHGHLRPLATAQSNIADRTMSPSSLGDGWKVAQQQLCAFGADRFLDVTNLLLENPNLNSTHLFRADILFDSSKELQTVAEKARRCAVDLGDEASTSADEAPAPFNFPDTTLARTVVRRLMPRKPQLDRPLDQWCYIRELTGASAGYVVQYVPQVQSETDMPWYHPLVKSLAYVYEQREDENTLSVHYLPFSSSSEAPDRLHRTFISLLQTFMRLAKNSPSDHQSAGNSGLPSLAPSALKDTILPQHIVQDTYTRLKQQYAADLISRWIEKTEPGKHVFEDLSIAAFLIELWKQMYPPSVIFPGFVDIACGNGVLTYVLIREGYQGRGFDARRRATWDILGVDDCLDEMICIPHPFLDHAPDGLSDLSVHNGIFPLGTFIISNHADELTPWTPILATLSSPESPLPFLAIPCCSHALSGEKHRYNPKCIISSTTTTLNYKEEQPASGDLKALRAAKSTATNHTDDKSMYACLTRKVAALAQEVGCENELTLMRIPSTRNIGIVGNRIKTMNTRQARAATTNGNIRQLQHEMSSLDLSAAGKQESMITSLLERESAMSGGVSAAAKIWIERARKLQKGQGRGKVNLGRKPTMRGHDT